MPERRAREADELEKDAEKAEKDGPPAADAHAAPPAGTARNGSSPPPAASPSHTNGTNGALHGSTATAAVPPVDATPARGPWRSYKEIVAQLAGRIVEAQRPIRVLQALRWGEGIEEAFTKTKQKEMPRVDAAYYERVELGFDVPAKVQEFEQIAHDIDRELGESDAIGNIMMNTALEYRDVVRMLASRGTPAFYTWSRRLYGSPKDKFPDGRSTVRDLGQLLYGILTSVDEWTVPSHAVPPAYARTIDAVDAARQLGERLAPFFGDAHVRCEADDGILADAAAGSDYVKVRTGAKFNARDIDILEVHEGWVHVGTSLNGQAQPVAKWLAKGPPRTTAVQEGLAALLEMFTFRTYPRRARRLNDRVLAVDKAEDGATFLDVFEWFRTEGYEEDECFHNTRRIFRGGCVEGGAPFTKDACYCRGIVLNYAFIRSAIQHNRVDLVPFLFVGKVAHEDVPVLARRVSDGVVRPPRYLPPMFRDLNGLAIWMAYSTFFSQLGGEAIADYYARLFAA
jgi:uncharacterized protein (TIGR02421 family)